MKCSLLLLLILPAVLYAQEIEVFSEKSDTAVNFYARSPYYCHYTADVSYATAENIITSVSLPASFIIDPRAEKQYLFSVKRKPGATKWGYRFKYRFTMGNVLTTKHDEMYAYQLPYKSERKHKMVQGYFGPFSHADVYALDFEMPIGTNIVAAREGVVIKIKEDSDSGGPTRDFIDRGNYVLIYHVDGTFGSYYHLRKGGVTVSPGDQVKRGDVIGFSGNTGWSSAPHLHFEVLIPSTDVKKTVPVRFKLSDGKIEELKEGNSY